jgi:hypothetical protein
MPQSAPTILGGTGTNQQQNYASSPYAPPQGWGGVSISGQPANPTAGAESPYLNGGVSQATSNPATPYNTLVSQLLGSQGYQTYQAGLNTQIGALQSQYNPQTGTGLIPAQTNQQIAQLRQSTGQQMQGLGLSGQQIGIQQAGLQAELGLAPQQQAIEQKQYQLSQQQMQAEKPGLASAAAGAGVAGAKGGAGSQYGATAGEKQQYGSLQREIQQGVLGQQSEVAGYNYSLGDLQRQSQSLSLAAQQNGLSEQETMTRLTQGINQLGLSGAISAQDILQQLGSTEAAGGQQLLSLLAPLAEITGLAFPSSETKK